MERGFNPDLIASERPKETANWRELASVRLGEYVQKRLEAWRGALPAEDWLRRGLILGAFLVPGGQIDDRIPSFVTLPSAERSVHGTIPESARLALMAFATQETHLDSGILSIGPYEKMSDGSYAEARSITSGDLTGEHPFVFENGVYQFILRRDLPASAFEVGNGWEVSRTWKSGDGMDVAFWIGSDSYGNGMSAVRVLAPDRSVVHETIKVFPDIPFDADGVPEIVALKVDLRAFGGGDLSGAFQTREAPLFVSTEHFSMYAYDGIFPEAKDMIAAQEGAIKKGLDDVAKLFGKPSTEISKILLLAGISPNAQVLLSQPDVVQIESQLFAKARLMSPEFMRSIARHEAVHAADTEYHFARSPLVQAAFLLMPDDGFALLDESRVYPHGFGGHSADNPDEFLASFVNSLVRPDWEQWVAIQPNDFRKAYLLAAQGLEVSLHAQTKIPDDAPIRSLTADRIRFLVVLE